MNKLLSNQLIVSKLRDKSIAVLKNDNHQVIIFEQVSIEEKIRFIYEYLHTVEQFFAESIDKNRFARNLLE